VRLPFRKARRKTPRFGVTGEPSYDRAEPTEPWRVASVRLTIANQSDVTHGVDEALVRFDDGRVGLGLRLDPFAVGRIPAHGSVQVEFSAAELGPQESATRFRVVVYSGKAGRRLEWSSRDMLLVAHGATPPT
jgi:hypothetical protein